MNAIITGPLDLNDYQLVKEVLDVLTFDLDDITLVIDLRPEEEFNIDPTSFPVAEKWLRHRWLRHVARNKQSRKFSKTVRISAPYTGDKQWSQGVREQRLEMVRNADVLIAFVDVGNVDPHSEELIKLAKVYDLEIRKVYI